MINVWILTVVITSSSMKSFQLKFDSLAKCESYKNYIEPRYTDEGFRRAKGICVQTQEQKINP